MADTVALVLAGGMLGGVLVDPLVGVGTVVALAVGLTLPRGPGVLAASSLGALGMAAAFTIAKQWRNHYPADFGWPGFFAPAHVLAWIGLLLIAASAVAAEARRRAGERAQPRP